MFFRINEERFKISSVTRYFKNGFSTSTKKYYLTVWFGAKDRLFYFDTEKELNNTIIYLDCIFKVKLI